MIRAGSQTAFFCLFLATIAPPLSFAEEGGSGHYFPGSMSSFVDGVPAEETVILRLNALAYDGDFKSNLAAPIAGLAALDAAVGLIGMLITTTLARAEHSLGQASSVYFQPACHQ